MAGEIGGQNVTVEVGGERCELGAGQGEAVQGDQQGPGPVFRDCKLAGLSDRGPRR